MWTKDGRDQSATLIQASAQDRPSVRIERASPVPYRAFLASAYMADLSRLAEFIPKTIPPLENYIPTRATRLDEDESDPHCSPQDHTHRLIPELVRSLPFGSTRMILVQGAPGSGKTMALQRMVSQRAQHYLDGEVPSLFFYIDVQGRALSRLDDAMARDLQDLRSKFSYTAVPPLVRNGLLVPVIDGFDELLGSGGYDEAFSSLAAFISQLEGHGAVVASARSTFFDYNAFRQNAERYAHDGLLNYDVRSVGIEPWDDVAADALVAKTSGDDEIVAEFRHLRATLDDSNRALLRKPFYVSQVAKLLASGDGIDSQKAILDTLVNKYLEREHSKLLDKDGQPLLQLSAHRRLLVALAEEMWWLETRQLDLGTVRAIVELEMEALNVPQDTARQVVARIPTYAFLTTSDGGRLLQFEHEMFYGYFLAAVLKEGMEGEPLELRRFLTRSLLDETVVDQIVDLYGDDVDAYTKAAIRVCDILGMGLGDGVARQNGGRFVARAVKECGGLGTGTRLSNLYFEQDDFGDATLESPRFRHCHFNGVNFTRLRMRTPCFHECTIQMPKISIERTRFEKASADLVDMVTGIEIVSLEEGGGADPRRQYAPDQIRAVLVQLGMDGGEVEAEGTAYSATQEERIRLLDKFLQKMESRFYVVDEDLRQFGLVNNQEWQCVYDLLKEYGIVREEIRPMSGPRKPLLRLSYPANVIREGERGTGGQVGEVRRFWSALMAGANG